ncbi:recombination protein NinG [Rahnella bonaserana]|uniref:recombination protein NinG n=1 Tax=Rahnella bonaserana TaxID=2816248 RepID=UPI00320B5392
MTPKDPRLRKEPKKPKPKTCCICSTKFSPFLSTQKTCSVPCAVIYGKRAEAKKQAKAEAASAKEGREQWRERKAKLKPLKHWEDMTQRAVNDYITKGRDVDEPCISCGTYETVQWEAGHYRSRGAASHLRYSEDNIHKQCHRCNAELSSNAIPYRAALVLKIGAERVEALENNNTPHRHTREELDGIRATYRAKLRASKKLQEAA